VWLIAHRNNLQEDPVVFALHDRASRWLMLIAVVILGVASYPL
jgi:hypothetical protein